MCNFQNSCEHNIFSLYIVAKIILEMKILRYFLKIIFLFKKNYSTKNAEVETFYSWNIKYQKILLNLMKSILYR